MNARRFLSHQVALTALLLALCVNALAQQKVTTPVRASSEEARVERLVGLAKAWGAVKFFHPYLAYREIDWDKALVETIPKVNAASSPQEYQAALNQMLAVLGDKSTRAEIETDKRAAVGADTKSAAQSQDAKTVVPGQASAASKEPVRTEDGVLIIDAVQISRTGAQDNAAFGVLVGKISQAIPTAKAVVIDARGETGAGELDANDANDFISFYFAMLLRRILPSLLDSNVTLGSARFRMHNGYATQWGGAGFYYSAFVNVAPEVVVGQNKTKTPPIVFVVNENAPEAADILSGLQWAGRAFVVQEGQRAPESGGGSFTLELPEGVRLRMRTYEATNPDGSVGFRADSVVEKRAGEDSAMREAVKAALENRNVGARAAAVAPPAQQVGQKDKPYAEMEFPSSEYRLLALFRFWNVINYFYPYKNLIGDSWETVLQRYVPKFEADKDAAEYQLTVREMVAEIHDSHGSVQNANASAERLGTYLPPLFVRYVEGQTVITKVLDDKLPVKVGDVILSVDGEPIEKLREYSARFIAASTPQALMRVVHAGLLRGQKDSLVKLRVRGTDGAVREVELTRSMYRTDPRIVAAMQRPSPVVQVLPSGFGYVDLTRLQVNEVDKMFETLQAAPAIIFDMRGYPNGTAWTIAPRLTEKKTPVAALFSRPLWEATGLSDSELSGTVNYSFAQRLPERHGDVYKGKVVVLINEDAISQAEHTCLFFEAATDVTFIGTPTTGANGDVTLMVLPGNLPVSFTGHNVRHADGRQLQRVGIQPNLTVAPTIRGLVEGRDEVLEAAVKYLQERGK